MCWCLNRGFSHGSPARSEEGNPWCGRLAPPHHPHREDAPGHHGRQKRDALGLGVESYRRLPLRCWARVSLSPTLSPAPVSPPPGLLLLGCYSPLASALLWPSWFSCFPPRQDCEPMGVTQGQDEADASQSISPSSYSRSCRSYQGFRRGFSLLWHQHPVKSPVLGAWGQQ